MITPDQPINPPDDDRFETCHDCNGHGKVLKVWDDPEDEEIFEPLLPQTETCTTCKGEGVLPLEKGGDEW